MNSASSAGTLRECERKFAFDKQGKLPRQENEQAEKGKIIHRVGELYHRDAIAPDPETEEGQVFLKALPFVPRPKTGRAEGEFHAKISGREYLGFIDLQCDASELPGSSYLPGEVPAVIDYKSKKEIRTTNRKNVLLGPGDFLDDPQALLYATKALIQTKANKVHLRWLYLQTEGKKKAFPSDVLLKRDDVVEAFGRIVHPLAVRMDEISGQLSTLDPLTLPPSPATCMKYGVKYACPYIAICNLSPGQQLAALDKEEPTMADDLLAKLRADKAAKQAQAPAAVPALPQAQAAAAKSINPPQSSVQTAPVRAVGSITERIERSKPAQDLAKTIIPGETPAAEPAPVSVPSHQHKATDGAISDAELGHAVRVLLLAFKGLFG